MTIGTVRTALKKWEYAVDYWAAYWLGRSLWLLSQRTHWHWPLRLGWALSDALEWLDVTITRARTASSTREGL